MCYAFSCSQHSISYIFLFTTLNLSTILLKACHSQKNTQRLLNQGMPKYGKHIKIRHIFLSEALADKMYIRTRRSISSVLFIVNKTNPSILPNRMFLSGCQPDVFLLFFCNHDTAVRKYSTILLKASDKDPLLERCLTACNDIML